MVEIDARTGEVAKIQEQSEEDTQGGEAEAARRDQDEAVQQKLQESGGQPRMKLLVLQHIACEHPGVFSEVIAERGVEAVPVELDEGEALPDWREFDAVLAMGGPMGAYDDAEHPWLAPRRSWCARRSRTASRSSASASACSCWPRRSAPRCSRCRTAPRSGCCRSS